MSTKTTVSNEIFLHSRFNAYIIKIIYAWPKISLKVVTVQGLLQKKIDGVPEIMFSLTSSALYFVMISNLKDMFYKHVRKWIVLIGWRW